MIPNGSTPTLVKGVRLREDRVRGGWTLLAPERALVANAVAVEVLKLCDGRRTFEQIIDTLTENFAINRERVESDVGALLSDLRAKCMVEL